MDLPWSPVFVPAAGGILEGDPLPPSAGLGGGAGLALGTDTSLPLFPIFSFDGPSLGAGLSLPQSIGEATALTIKATWRSRDSPLSSSLTVDTVGVLPLPPCWGRGALRIRPWTPSPLPWWGGRRGAGLRYCPQAGSPRGVCRVSQTRCWARGQPLLYPPSVKDPSLFDLWDYHISVCGWNVNGVRMDMMWAEELYGRGLWMFFSLVDTRTSLAQKDYVHNALKFGLAEEYIMYVFPGRSSGVKGRNKHVWGITMLVSKRSRSGWSVSKFYPDPSGCGIYLAADLNNADGRRVKVMGVYLPVEASDKQFNEYSLGTAAEERSIQKLSLARKVRDHIGTLPKAGQSPTLAG
jgi:hypothetical protein